MSAELRALLERVAAEPPRYAGIPLTKQRQTIERRRQRIARLKAVIARNRGGVA